MSMSIMFVFVLHHVLHEYNLGRHTLLIVKDQSLYFVNVMHFTANNTQLSVPFLPHSCPVQLW